MKKIDWSYHRRGCETCAKTQAFLSDAGIEPTEQVDARKEKLGQAEALALLDQVDELYVTRGRRLIHFDLKNDRPDNAELTSLIIGRSGTLRAPTIRHGRTLLVGFHAETYEKVLG